MIPGNLPSQLENVSKLTMTYVTAAGNNNKAWLIVLVWF